MNDLRTAAQQALEALRELLPDARDPNCGGYDARDVRQWRATAGALRAALAQQAEPVTEDMKSAVRWAPSSAYWSERLREFFGPDAREGIDALERRLAEAQQAEPVEPVAWHYTNNGGGNVMHWGPSARLDADIQAVKDYPRAHKVTPLYTTPPQRKPLSEREILEAVGWERAEMWMKLTPNFPVDEARKETIKNARAVEKASWEKNHG